MKLGENIGFIYISDEFENGPIGKKTWPPGGGGGQFSLYDYRETLWTL